ncbi:hypothetical protein KBZ08_12920 [Cyanobium sp. Candia 9D4]|uniref:hypothetical protein n=1 Tax=Cyanobium sp. Candia 9D4 TaxID=2823707 RepID=UPI0020CFBA6F|nr:hypothetical protein [Cyanobium sp. Candia 9D4]MCP9934816.1 hypothetical protein [Cyanobium sp. Candia 9D4]
MLSTVRDLYALLSDGIFSSPSGLGDIVTSVDLPEESILSIGFPGQPINPSQYDNPWSPSNLTGSVLSLENFSVLVDQIPQISQLYSPSAYSVDTLYGQIVNSAQASLTPPSSQAMADYQAAYDYLYAEADRRDAAGRVVKVAIEKPEYKRYLEKRAAYNNSLQSYMTSYSSLSTTDPAKWALIGPVLQQQVDLAWSEFKAASSPSLERALSILRQSGSDASTSIIDNAKKKYLTTQQASLSSPGITWHSSFPIPYNWYSETAADLFNEVSIDRVSFKFLRVEIVRPWLDLSMLSLPGWSIPGLPAGYYSNGEFSDNTGIFPLLPTAFIVARDIDIKGSISGQEVTILKTKGPLIIGWISRLLPPMPPR